MKQIALCAFIAALQSSVVSAAVVERWKIDFSALPEIESGYFVSDMIVKATPSFGGRLYFSYSFSVGDDQLQNAPSDQYPSLIVVRETSVYGYFTPDKSYMEIYYTGRYEDYINYVDDEDSSYDFVALDEYFSQKYEIRGTDLLYIGRFDGAGGSNTRERYSGEYVSIEPVPLPGSLAFLAPMLVLAALLRVRRA